MVLSFLKSLPRRHFLLLGCFVATYLATIGAGRPPEWLQRPLYVTAAPFILVRMFYQGADAPPNWLDLVVTVPLALFLYSRIDLLLWRLLRRFPKRSSDAA